MEFTFVQPLNDDFIQKRHESLSSGLTVATDQYCVCLIQEQITELSR